MPTIEFIDSVSALNDFCQHIFDAPWLAIDTEFMREKTYYPKFCLLQVATPEQVACIDPIALEGELAPLFEIINNPNIIKVLHASRQDIEIFYQLTGKIPSPIYDTQVAAPLLGHQENAGYAMLVSGMLNINLSKVQTRTDWAKRPLSKEQIDYAADDVVYLGKIYQIMHAKLVALGRDKWLEDDFKQLTRPELYAIEDDKAWLRIKGKNKLTGKQLAILKALAEWREKLAKQSDLPKNWIVRDDALLDMARLQPKNNHELSQLRSISDGFLRRNGKAACDIVKQSQDLSLSLDDKPNKAKKTLHQEAIVDVLMGWVRMRADENALNPVSLATRKDLEALVANEADCVLKTGWRYGMIGRELEQILQGTLKLSVDDNTLVLQ